ncbi:MAG: PKD domain-containing protein [Acidobacteriota bacterium]
MSRPIALLATLALSAAACDKVPLLAPTQSTITLTVNTTTVPVNGTATVIASVTEQAGTPAQNGTVVTFTASFGTIEPAEARTEGGKATVTFRAGSQSGVAKIGAFSGATRATEVEVRVGGAAAERVVVRAEPASVPPGGGSVQVIAIVTDANGNALPGAPTVFSADNGTLGSNSGVTDANGEVRTTLTTNRETVVRANVAGKEGQLTVRVGTLPNITISGPSTASAVGTPVTFTVTPNVATGAPPIQSVVVDFGDGTPTTNLGAISAATGVSHVFSREGTFTVTATATDFSGQRNSASTVVTLQRNLPVVSISANPTSVTAGAPVTFTITSQPASNGPPLSTVRVNFPDGSSVAVATGTQSLSRTFTTPGTYIVRAVATDNAGTTSEASVVVQVTPAATPDVTISVPSYVPSGGSPTTPNPACGTSTNPVSQCTVILPAGTAQSVSVAFLANVTFTGGEVATTYTWTFGDGTSSTTSGPRIDHTYVATGTYAVRVAIATSLNRTVTGGLSLIVQSVTSAPPLTMTFDFTSMVATNANGTTATRNCTGTVCSFTAATAPVRLALVLNAVTPLLTSPVESVIRYDWAFSDGGNHSTTAPRTDHLYSSLSTFNLTVTATTNLGRTVQIPLTVILQ